MNSAVSPFDAAVSNRAAYPSDQGLGVIVATSFGFALVQLDVSIVNVALARIGTSLGGSISSLQWVVDAYAIAFASLLLGAGALGDRLGARRTYVAGLIVFTLASLGCGLAPGEASLIAARVLQGIGAALLVPCSLALLTHAYGDDEAGRTHAISLWTAAASTSLAAGPLLGGMLVDSLGWRSIFLVNLPVGAIGVWLTYRTVSEAPRRNGSIDLLGQALAVPMLLGLTAAVIEAGRLGPAAPFVIGSLALAAVCGSAFLVVEARAQEPMLPLGFFHNATFSAATLVGLVINLTLYGTIFVFALYLQQALHYSPIRAGLAFLPLPIVLGFANVAAGRIGVRFGRGRRMALGLSIAAFGYWLLGQLHTNSTYPSLLPALMVIPAGVGLAVPLMTSALLATVPRSRSGAASGVLNTVRQAGGAIGVAVFGALLAGHGVAGVRFALLGSAVLLVVVAPIAAIAVQPRCSPSAQG